MTVTVEGRCKLHRVSSGKADVCDVAHRSPKQEKQDGEDDISARPLLGWPILKLILYTIPLVVWVLFLVLKATAEKRLPGFFSHIK